MTVSCFMCDKAVSTHDDLFCDKSVDALKKKNVCKCAMVCCVTSLYIRDGQLFPT